MLSSAESYACLTAKRGAGPEAGLFGSAEREMTMVLPAARPTSVEEVATAAGVSLGTASNVLKPPDRVTPAIRVRVEQAMRPGLRAQRVGTAAARGHQSHALLRHARRDEPVLHGRRPGDRAGCRGRRPLAAPVQQRQPVGPRGRACPPAAAATGSGRPDHPRQPVITSPDGGVAAASAHRPAGPAADRRSVLQRLGRRCPRRPARREPPRPTGAPTGRVHRRSDGHRTGPRAAPRARA